VESALPHHHPFLGEQGGLFQHGLGGFFLFVGRVAVFAQDALDDDAQLGADGLAQGPVYANAAAHRLDEFAGNGAQGIGSRPKVSLEA